MNRTSTINEYFYIRNSKIYFANKLEEFRGISTFVGKNQEKLNQVIEALSKTLQPLQDLEDFLNEVLEAQN